MNLTELRSTGGDSAVLVSLFPGVGQLTLGTPEQLTPVLLRDRAPAAAALGTLPAPSSCPIDASRIKGRASTRGYVIEIPLEEDEELYGFGLQFKSFRQRPAGKVGLKKTIRVNSDPSADTGDSHAPVPFYVSTRGYGVLVDTARYATFYCGCAQAPVSPEQAKSAADVPSAGGRSASELVDSIRNRAANPNSSAVRVDIPHAAGADVYVFWGADLREAVQRYNLFSGGGCLPPRWGLGPWYRVRADFNQDEVVQLASHVRERDIPCDVLGLEPGWQTHSYPCSFEWSDKFPRPQELMDDLKARGLRVNLWTHIFTHHASPIYETLMPHSGDFVGMGGLVPDLSVPEARRIFVEHHESTHAALGVSGYKLDECDNSDFTGISWSFPEISEFPSGLDGEQMHSLIGNLYQETIDSVFEKRNQRTYGSVRAAHALAAPYPFVLYSDLYDHREFIRALVNSGFSGLLWTPELRHAVSTEDLVRRLQSIVCSPQALINGWYIKSLPWEQPDAALNNAGELAEGWEQSEALCRDLLNLRMQFVPYLYAAFARYQQEGLAPFRALVQDYPDDLNARIIDDQYMMGDVLLVAPMIAGQQSRRVYLPEGEWFDFWTGEKQVGSRKIEVAASLETFPLFVKAGALLPLAAVTQHAGEPQARELSVRVYGDGRLGCTLFEDDGESFNYREGSFNRLHLSWDAISQQGSANRVGTQDYFTYEVKHWISP